MKQAQVEKPERSETVGTHPGLLSRYLAVRDTSYRLCAPLSSEDCAVQSMPDASPVKWHLAHTSWFFETFVLGRDPDYKPFDPSYKVLFNSYYHSVGAQHPRPQRGLLTRPNFDIVLAYRKHVDEHIMRLHDQGRGFQGNTADLVETGLQHEQQHQELMLTDIKHLFSCNPLKPAYQGCAQSTTEAAPAMQWLYHAAGTRWLGHQGGGFGFDNETPRHHVRGAAFALATRLVTNGEYLEFIEDRGYGRPELWLSDGWSTAQANGWQAPLYWEKRGDRWHELTLAGLRTISHHTPVCHVSYYEASAYAAWKGARLPTEVEWEHAAQTIGVPEGNFLECGLLHPTVAKQRHDPSDLQQLFGDTWEWTASAYLPYPGYRTPAGALGEYNAKFMCNQMVLRGGCCVTPCSHIRPSYRNFF
ncbi:MAG: ergothioneine biosynthesis protein EgtB, partial [Gammaproteobacteria bacterium]